MLKPTEMDLEFAKKRNWNNHSVELKLDGFRAFFIKGDLFSEREVKRNDRFPHIIEALKEADCVLDGEIAIDEKSTVFDVSRKENWHKAKYYIFDIVELNGEDLRKLSLKQRHDILLDFLLNISSKSLTLPRTFDSFKDGWDYVIKNNLEGLVIKDLNSTYPKGNIFKKTESRYWRKLKNWQETKLEIVGHEAGSTKGAFVCENDIRISALSPQMVIEWQDMKQFGKVYGEIAYLRKTEDGKLFQPILKRLIK